MYNIFVSGAPNIKVYRYKRRDVNMLRYCYEPWSRFNQYHDYHQEDHHHLSQVSETHIWFRIRQLEIKSEQSEQVLPY